MKTLLRKLRKVVFHLVVLSLPALLLLLFLAEVVVRLALPVSDVPDTCFHPLLGNHYLPGQSGVYIKGNGSEIRANYRINAQGWNSPRDYEDEKPPGTLRVAVIGDSYVEAFQVDVDRAFPVLVERGLQQRLPTGTRAQVYTYGHSGANLMQYLAVLRQVVMPARPDLVIVCVVHNDFQESLEEFGRSDNWTVAFQNGAFREVPPRPAGNLGRKRLLRKSALARYLIVNLEIHRRFNALSGAVTGDVREQQANVDVKSNTLLGDKVAMRSLLRYLLGKFRDATGSGGSQLLLLVDANRQAIYRGDDPGSTRIHAYNRALADEAGEIGIPLLDLTATFEHNWKAEHERFDFESNGHWNRHGHAVVAAALLEWIQEHAVLPVAAP